MDEMVLRAMEKWPNVPAVFGWLRLDRRGRWWIRNKLLSNPVMIDFIGRNYLADAFGRYYFQNGPQKVFVELEATPWIYSLTPSSNAQMSVFTDQTGVQALPEAAGIDDEGALYLLCEGRIGVVDERDLIQVIELMTDANGRKTDDLQLASWMDGNQSVSLLLVLADDRRLPLQRLSRQNLPSVYGYQLRPSEISAD